MAPKAHFGCRSTELRTRSPERWVSRSLYPPSPPNSNTAPRGGRITRQRAHAPIPADIYKTRRSRQGAKHLLQERLMGCQDGRRRRSRGTSEETQGKGTSVASGASSGSAAFARTVSSCISESERLSDDQEGTRPQSSSPALEPTSESQPDVALLGHRALKKQEEQERKKASNKYQETGDMSVFAPFMAPFFDGPDRPDLGPWVWDASVERFRREHKLNGRTVWAPTDDSFI